MSYYNTTNESGKDLKDHQKKAMTQNEIIMNMFEGGAKLSPSLIMPQMKCPITSVRRALNTLERHNKIRRLDVKIYGLYGRKEYMYTKV